jgi:hypothetical protein
MSVHRFHPPALHRFFRYCQRRFESGTRGRASNKKLQVKSQNKKTEHPTAVWSVAAGCPDFV